VQLDRLQAAGKQVDKAGRQTTTCTHTHTHITPPPHHHPHAHAHAHAYAHAHAHNSSLIFVCVCSQTSMASTLCCTIYLPHTSLFFMPLETAQRAIWLLSLSTCWQRQSQHI
jgi:hypothetical protein